MATAGAGGTVSSGGVPGELSDSFWDVGNYKVVLQRMENDAKLCDDFISLVRQRAEIERTYSKMVAEWGARWKRYIEGNESPEYGTLRNGWRALSEEATTVSSIHQTIAEQLSNKVEGGVQSWKKENFQKSVIHYKIVKKSEEQFEAAQAPWTKRKIKVEKNKRAYHAAMRAAEQLSKKHEEMMSDAKATLEELRKLKERVSKAIADARAAREKYQESLDDITKYNSTYMAEMKAEFTGCQTFEQQRINFFKDRMSDFCEVLHRRCDPRFAGAQERPVPPEGFFLLPNRVVGRALLSRLSCHRRQRAAACACDCSRSAAAQRSEGVRSDECPNRHGRSGGRSGRILLQVRGRYANAVAAVRGIPEQF